MHDDHVPSNNIAVVRGVVRGTPARRELPAAGIVVQFDVSSSIAPTSTGGAPANVSVPVAWIEPPAAALATLVDGAEVVVVGTVRRRFFRVGGATQSRTEVVADVVIPARRRAKVDAALGEVAARLMS
jgi:single-strand DNA-binding protein